MVIILTQKKMCRSPPPPPPRWAPFFFRPGAVLSETVCHLPPPPPPANTLAPPLFISIQMILYFWNSKRLYYHKWYRNRCWIYCASVTANLCFNNKSRDFHAVMETQSSQQCKYWTIKYVVIDCTHDWFNEQSSRHGSCYYVRAIFIISRYFQHFICLMLNHNGGW